MRPSGQYHYRLGSPGGARLQTGYYDSGSYQRDEMLKDTQPAAAKLHLDDGGLDFWKIP